MFRVGQIGSSLARILAISLLIPMASPSSAVQLPNQPAIPNLEYYRSYEFLKDGKTDEADAGFRTALRPFNLPMEQRGFESIPSIVMLGETYYHQGHSSKALEYYESALTLLARSSGWVRYVEPILPATKAEGPSRGIAWAQSDRKTQPGLITNRWQYTVVPNGIPFHGPTGETALPGARSTVDAMEILRTSAIALRRRWQLLGRYGGTSKLNREVEESLASNLGKLDPSIQLGHRLCQSFASLAEKDPDKLLLEIQSTTSLPGDVDCSLTPLALMVQGELAAKLGDWPAASRLFLSESRRCPL